MKTFLPCGNYSRVLCNNAGYNFGTDNFGVLSYHRIIEAFKFAYAQRLHLGDPDFNSTIDEVSGAHQIFMDK